MSDKDNSVPNKSIVDLDQLRKNNPPLAKIVEALHDSRTSRDVSGADIAQDIALMLAARSENTKLGQALDEYTASVDMEQVSSELHQALTGQDTVPRIDNVSRDLEGTLKTED